MYFLHIIKKKGSFKLEKEILSDIKQLENNLIEGDVHGLEQKRHEWLELKPKNLMVWLSDLVLIGYMKVKKKKILVTLR